MRALFTLFLSVATLCFLGCASEGPTPDEFQEQLRRGVSGEGQLTPDMDRTNDPYVKPREGRPTPRE
ncbi:MAG: hypothetical protein H0U88_03155 [Chthoniobacterales bacterium]|nr:hypothetical protein [Chthoniobacterales bacterium]MDQ3119148.1 hypothetical protein [Verrucomicrobiota bacterium]